MVSVHACVCVCWEKTDKHGQTDRPKRKEKLNFILGELWLRKGMQKEKEIKENGLK